MEETLQMFTKALADAIRAQDGTTEPINPQDFAARILALSNGEPIDGEVRIFYDDTKPASKWGGSWSEDKFLNGTFLMAAGSGGTAGISGGSNSVKLTVDNLPRLSNYLFPDASSAKGHGNAVSKYLSDKTMGNYGDYGRGWNVSEDEMYPAAETLGNDQPFDNRPQYVTVHIWRKVS